MKLIVNVPLCYSREYLKDLDKNTLPNVGDDFEEKYYVRHKTIENDVCTLNLGSQILIMCRSLKKSIHSQSFQSKANSKS